MTGRVGSLGRREFLRAASWLGVGAGLGPAARALSPETPREMTIEPEHVRFRPEIEPVVDWIERTPRDKIFEKALEELKRGLSYRDLLAGLFLAGIRDVKPRPVGFKFHAVLVINSAHLLAQSATVEDRLLPLFWALDNFKNSQEADVREGDWKLSAVDEARIPRPSKAMKAFNDAMDNWDAEAADVAVAGLCRSQGAAETMEAFWRFGTRDFRNIGHKAIFTAQCWRTLQTIGWQHAEPVLRSLAFGTLDRMKDLKKEPVGPYEANLERAMRVREDWQTGRLEPNATKSLLAAFRQASPEDASAAVFEAIDSGISPDSIWDALVLRGGELMMLKPGILPIHAVTSTNALHYIYRAAGSPTIRLLALAQAASWSALFREAIKPPEGPSLTAIEPIPTESKPDEAIADVFDALSTDRLKAAGKLLGYLRADSHADPRSASDTYFAAARRTIFRKGRDSHDYKFGAAAWEEFALAADDRWRAPLAVASLFNLPASDKPESPLMTRAREAVAGLLGPKT